MIRTFSNRRHTLNTRSRVTGKTGLSATGDDPASPGKHSPYELIFPWCVWKHTQAKCTRKIYSLDKVWKHCYSK